MATVMMIFAVAMISGCKKDSSTTGSIEGKPTVKTLRFVFFETPITAQCYGVVEDDGGSPILARGICWNTSGNPTISDNYKNDEIAAVGDFHVELTRLEPNTKYYIRAYAANENGTAYGEQYHFTTGDPGVIPGEIQRIPYFQNFDTEFGTYTTKNVIGDQEWEIDDSAATMVGYDNLGLYENEDWLISSPVSVTGVSHAKMTMNYVGCYFQGITNYVTVWASTNYEYGAMPSTATWTRVPAILYESDNWYDYKTAEVDLDDYLGQTVTLAVKYTSYNGNAGGISIRSISIEEGEVYGGGATQNLPYFQSFENEFGTYIPKSVVGDLEWNIDYSTAWMQGYLYNYNNSGNECFDNEDWLISSPVSLTGVQHVKMVMTYIGRYFNSFGINNGVTIWVSTNYHYGDIPSTASWIQIPANLEQASNWTDFLTVELSLDDYIGQTVTVAVKYISNTETAGNIEIQSISVEEGSANGGGETQYLPYTQSFATDFGSYITQSVIGDQKWTIDYSTAKMTGYVSGSYYENEDWLISSPVAITGVGHANMIITYIGRYFNNINDDVTIWVSTNYQFGYPPSLAIWTQIPATLDESSNWNEFKTTELSLDEYIGQTVTVAVKYLSTDTKAGTIEVKSITIQ